MKLGMHSKVNRGPFIGTTAIEVNPEAVAVEYYQRIVQGLTDVILLSTRLVFVSLKKGFAMQFREPAPRDPHTKEGALPMWGFCI
jgi:hypothetical protein